MAACGRCLPPECCLTVGGKHDVVYAHCGQGALVPDCVTAIGGNCGLTRVISYSPQVRLP